MLLFVVLSRIFSKVLQSHFEVEVASDGDDTFMRLSHINPDVIILDLNLPGMDGKEILFNIRRDRRLKNIPVVLCTADDRTAEMLRDEADIVLLKPVNPMQLQ